MERYYRIIRRKSQTPVYNIGVISQLTGLPIWTIRWIEKHELIIPQRTPGNQRLFSDTDLAVLHQIRELLEEEVNLPGIRVILRMRMEYTVNNEGTQEEEDKPEEKMD